MDQKGLHAFFPFLCNHRTHAQSETRIDALSRMYIAVNDLICTLAIDDYGNRRKITRKIDSLYKTLDRSSIKNLTRMYRLTKEVSMAVYGDKDRECSGIYYDSITSYLKDPDPEVEPDVMRCIVYELGDIPEDNTEFDFYPYFRNKCRQWAGELDGAGCWKGIPEATALERLGLLQDNSCVFRDDSFSDGLMRAYGYYRKHLILPRQAEAEDLPLLGAWYDLLRIPGVLPYEPALSGRIARLMEDFANAEKPRSDEWYFATSYAVMQGCTDTMDNAQTEMIWKAG